MPFEQEAKTPASLDHPNILSIFEVGTHDGTPYLVSQFLDGRTLREELKNGALPLRKAIDYALQIANGLAAAHAKGITHRDLKPENIFVTKDDRVKILDFGLAKLRSPSPVAPRHPLPSDGRGQGEGSVSDAVTLVQTTEPGMVLGTVGYMSPEQVRGEESDYRSDIFAFGCILYEMLSSQRAVRKETSAETMAAILKEDPPELAHTNPMVSPSIQKLLERCLAKEPENRFQSAKHIGFAMEAIVNGSQRREALAGSAPQSRSVANSMAWPAVLLVLGALLGVVFMQMFVPPRPSGIPSIRYLTYSGADYSPAVSGDGRRVCFSSDRDGTNRIWIKEIASGWEQAITSGPDHSPRFSPDLILRTRRNRLAFLPMGNF